MMAPTTSRKSGFLEEAACPAFLLFSHAFPREVPSGRISGAAPRMSGAGVAAFPSFRRDCLESSALVSPPVRFRFYQRPHRLCLSGTAITRGSLDAPEYRPSFRCGILQDCRRYGRIRAIQAALCRRRNSSMRAPVIPLKNLTAPDASRATWQALSCLDHWVPDE